MLLAGSDTGCDCTGMDADKSDLYLVLCVCRKKKGGGGGGLVILTDNDACDKDKMTSHLWVCDVRERESKPNIFERKSIN